MLAENLRVRKGLTAAAGLLAVLLLALTLATSGRARSNTVHTCSATDRQFIETARTNMTALELWSEQYQSGEATEEDVVGQARAAGKIMRGTGPTDYSLQQTRRLVMGMMSEYAKACSYTPAIATPARTCTGHTGSRTLPTQCSCEQSGRLRSSVATSDPCSDPQVI